MRQVCSHTRTFYTSCTDAPALHLGSFLKVLCDDDGEQESRDKCMHVVRLVSCRCRTADTETHMHAVGLHI